MRALQEEEIRPVGEPRTLQVDVRIVAATSRDLETEVAAGRFRDDLDYRLNVVRVRIPPLRERPEDLPELAQVLLDRMARRMGKAVGGLSAEVLSLLALQPWFGNVRELENALERALILARGRTLTADLFPFGAMSEPVVSAAPSPLEDLSIKRNGRRMEERLIRAALERTDGNRTRAAEILELSPRALQYKIKEYGV